MTVYKSSTDQNASHQQINQQTSNNLNDANKTKPVPYSNRIIASSVKTLIFTLSVTGLPFASMQLQAATKGFDNCGQHFLAGQPPFINNLSSLVQNAPKTNDAKKQRVDSLVDDKGRSYDLCFNGFALKYSAYAKSALWSAEHITADRLYQADEMERVDSFHEEDSLLLADRVQSKTYSHSGFDRGHLAPNADMKDFRQQYDSFSLTNIVPQSPYLNRYIWKEVEANARYYAKKHEHAYIITGVLYQYQTEINYLGANNDDNANSANHAKSADSQNYKQLLRLNASVAIPSHLYKAVYLPTIRQAAVYVAPNDESGRLYLLSLDALYQQTGVVAFPSLNAFPRLDIEHSVSDVATDAATSQSSKVAKTSLLPEPTQAIAIIGTDVNNKQANETNYNANNDNANNDDNRSWLINFGVAMWQWLQRQLTQ